MQHAVGIVDFRMNIVVEVVLRILAVEIHAGKRRDAEPVDRLPKIKGGVDVDRRHRAGPDLELVSAGDARAVEQRIEHQFGRVGVGSCSHQSVKLGNSSGLALDRRC